MPRFSIARPIAMPCSGWINVTVDNEHVGFLDLRQVVHDGFRGALAIAPTIEGPGAAEGAVPRTAAGKFNRRTWVQHANKILVAFASEITGREVLVEPLQ